jgi:hypothetical protein
MRSPEEQEVFLQQGRFDEGEQSIARRKVPLMMISGVLLVATAIICLVLPELHRAHEAMEIGSILAIGCLLSAIPGCLDRTGATSIICAGCVFLYIVRAALLSPAEPNPGAGVLAMGPSVLAGVVSSFAVGILFFGVGAVGKVPR